MASGTKVLKLKVTQAEAKTEKAKVVPIEAKVVPTIGAEEALKLHNAIVGGLENLKEVEAEVAKNVLVMTDETHGYLALTGNGKGPAYKTDGEWAASFGWSGSTLYRFKMLGRLAISYEEKYEEALPKDDLAKVKAILAVLRPPTTMGPQTGNDTRKKAFDQILGLIREQKYDKAMELAHSTKDGIKAKAQERQPVAVRLARLRASITRKRSLVQRIEDELIGMEKRERELAAEFAAEETSKTEKAAKKAAKMAPPAKSVPVAPAVKAEPDEDVEPTDVELDQVAPPEQVASPEVLDDEGDYEDEDYEDEDDEDEDDEEVNPIDRPEKADEEPSPAPSAKPGKPIKTGKKPAKPVKASK